MTGSELLYPYDLVNHETQSAEPGQLVRTRVRSELGER